jgi:outer membrane protein assembly factor BamB
MAIAATFSLAVTSYVKRLHTSGERDYIHLEKFMDQQPTNAGSNRNRRYLYLLAIVLAGGLLLGGYFWMTKLHPISKPITFTSEPANIYIARNNHLVKLDGHTGAILWQHILTPPGVNSPQTCTRIIDGVLYAILDYDSYAFRTSDGTQLWHISTPRTQSSNLACQIADGKIYVLHRDGTYSALDTKTGALLWHSAVVLTDSMIFQVQHGAIYSEQNVGTSPRLIALDCTTGKERWHVDLEEGNDGFPTRVAGGIVYHATGSSLYALDETTGHIIWQQHTDQPGVFFTDPYIAHGVLYVETSAHIATAYHSTPRSNTEDSPYRIYAFAAQKGTPLWKSNPGLQFVNDTNPSDEHIWSPTGGMIIAHQEHGTTSTLYALDSSNGTVHWQADLNGSWQAILGQKQIALLESDNSGESQRLQILDLSSGQQLVQQTLAVQNQGQGVEFAGIDNSRIYVLAKGNESTLDVIHALSLTNGADLWHYQVANYASGSIEMPIVAP